jgi:hypothetical protein
MQEERAPMHGASRIGGLEGMHTGTDAQGGRKASAGMCHQSAGRGGVEVRGMTPGHDEEDGVGADVWGRGPQGAGKGHGQVRLGAD